MNSSRQSGSGLKVASGLAFFFVVLVFVARLFILQVIQGPRFLKLSVNNSLRGEEILAERGLILDAAGAVLAKNGPSFDLWFDPRRCPNLSCDLSFLKSDELKKDLAARPEPRLIRDVGQALALSLGQKDLRDYLKIKIGLKRDYPLNEAAFGVLGYLSLSDAAGASGLEKSYDEHLRGRPGWQFYEADAHGRILSRLKKQPPQAGSSLVLSLEAPLQQVSFEALSAALKKSGARSGAVVASDPQSGRILALVSLPSLNPNLFSSVLSRDQFKKMENDPGLPFFNRVISGSFPPGSIFKMVVAAAALSRGTIAPATLIDGPGVIAVGSFTYRDWRPQGHGRLNLVGALAQSCDTCFYTLGGGYGSQRGVGEEAIFDLARRFGLGRPLGLDLPGEVGGLVGDENWKKEAKGEPWYVGDTYHLSIGQGFLHATPLQINFLTAAVANGGTLYRPFLVTQIKDEKGVVANFRPQILRKNLVEAEFLETIAEGLKQALKPGGTGYPFFDFAHSAAGKTGTAETGKRGKTHAWFSVFAEAENPKIALTVFLEEGGEGSRDAAPVARQILDWYFAHH